MYTESSPVLIKASQVQDFIRSFSLTREGFRKNHELFRDLLDNLKTRINQVSTRESDFYKKFGTLQEIQQRFNAINSSNLGQLANYAIRANTELTSNLNEFTTKTIADAFKAAIEHGQPENIFQTIITNAENKITDVSLKTIVDALNKERSLQVTTTAKKQPKTVRKTSVETAINLLLQYTKDPKSVSSLKTIRKYKPELTTLLSQTSLDTGQSALENKSTWNLEIENPAILTEPTNLCYYPYYQLTEEERQLALSASGLEVWEQFKQHLINFINLDQSILSKADIEVILDRFGPSSFIVPDLKNLIGILGEVQATISFAAIMKNVSLLPVGNLQDKLNNNNKLGVDILLNMTDGIQVKNYFGCKNGAGYHLRQAYQWDTIKDSLDSDVANELGSYYAIRAFNQSVPNGTPGYSSAYQDFYNSFVGPNSSTNNMLNAFWAANIDIFFPITSQYQLTEEYQGDYDTIFYLFGGRTIIPTSYIYRLLYQRIEQIRQSLIRREHTQFANFRSTVSYSGGMRYQYATEDQTLREINNYTMREILDTIRLNVDLNIYLEDLELERGGPSVTFTY